MKLSDMILEGDVNAKTVIVLAHGAGAPMDTPFMNYFATELVAVGYRVARFEFPYMARRRTEDKKPGPDREPKLRASWLTAIEMIREQQSGKVVIGGKSMGGRMASLIADEAPVDRLVCLGYPFHPPAKPDRLRTEHLLDIQTPTLIVQGTRDPFGKPDEVATYGLGEQVELQWLDDGDHSFKPRKSSGRTELQNWAEAVAAIHRFCG